MSAIPATRKRSGRTTNGAVATVSQLKDRTYAVFTGTGMRVDLKAFFNSDAGREAVIDVARAAGAKRPR